VPDFEPIRVFLDANVLFSASYSDRNRFLQFWRMEGVTPVTSPYAIGEVRGHLRRPGHFERFEDLAGRTDLVSDVDLRIIPSGVFVVEKDRPILAAAIGAGIDYLVTGDKNHFSHLYDTTVGFVSIMSPTDFLDRFADRVID
jgi:predicted nucleic acid-binding protein